MRHSRSGGYYAIRRVARLYSINLVVVPGMFFRIVYRVRKYVIVPSGCVAAWRIIKKYPRVY